MTTKMSRHFFSLLLIVLLCLVHPCISMKLSEEQANEIRRIVREQKSAAEKALNSQQMELAALLGMNASPSTPPAPAVVVKPNYIHGNRQHQQLALNVQQEGIPLIYNSPNTVDLNQQEQQEKQQFMTALNQLRIEQQKNPHRRSPQEWAQLLGSISGGSIHAGPRQHQQVHSAPSPAASSHLSTADYHHIPQFPVEKLNMTSSGSSIHHEQQQQQVPSSLGAASSSNSNEPKTQQSPIENQKETAAVNPMISLMPAASMEIVRPAVQPELHPFFARPNVWQMLSAQWANGRFLARIEVGNEIPAKQMETLRDGKWLYDDILNAYLHLLTAQLDNVTYISTFHIALYMRDREIPHFFLKQLHLDRSRWIFVPAHLAGNHWALVLLDIPRHTIFVLDSMCTGRVEPTPKWGESVFDKDGRQILSKRRFIGRMLNSFIVKLYEQKGRQPPIQWNYEEASGLPQQQNGNDCGVFLLAYARHLILDDSRSMNFEAKHIPYFRRLFCAELIRNTIYGGKDPKSTREQKVIRNYNNDNNDQSEKKRKRTNNKHPGTDVPAAAGITYISDDEMSTRKTTRKTTKKTTKTIHVQVMHSNKCVLYQANMEFDPQTQLLYGCNGKVDFIITPNNNHHGSTKEDSAAITTFTTTNFDTSDLDICGYNLRLVLSSSSNSISEDGWQSTKYKRYDLKLWTMVDGQKILTALASNSSLSPVWLMVDLRNAIDVNNELDGASSDNFNANVVGIVDKNHQQLSDRTAEY